MLTAEDLKDLEMRGITEEQINNQLACFEKGFPFLDIKASASVEKGIKVIQQNEQSDYMNVWDEYLEQNHRIVKFVPASGAASRMFKDLFAFMTGDHDAPSTKFEQTFFENIEYNRFWLEVFENLKARGIDFVLFLVTPHNKNIERCSKIVYNGVNIIYSPEELLIDITRFFTEKSSRKFVRNLKDLFFAKTLENHLTEMKMFEEQFANNKNLLS